MNTVKNDDSKEAIMTKPKATITSTQQHPAWNPDSRWSA